MNRRKTTPSDDMRAEYDFDYSKAVRGKYHRRILKEGSNIVVLDPDLAPQFPDSAAVNAALREWLKTPRRRRRRRESQ